MPSQDWQYKNRDNGIVDPWLHINMLIPNAYTYQWQCVEQMDAIRRANNYRPKVYAIPDDSTWYPIATAGMQPFSTYNTQVRMLPNTLILGFQLWPDTSQSASPDPDNFYVTVTDDGTGTPIIDGWMAEVETITPVTYTSLIAPAGRQCFSGKTPWFPLPKPRVILDPGIVSIEFCRKNIPGASLNSAPQLLLFCAQPCSVTRGVEECQ